MRGTSVINSDVRINGGLTVSNGSTADINGQTVFGGSANVSVPGGETLDLNGVTEFQGGSHLGGGTVNQFSNSSVTANTIIDYSTYNWDGLVGGQNVNGRPQRGLRAEREQYRSRWRWKYGHGFQSSGR